MTRRTLGALASIAFLGAIAPHPAWTQAAKPPLVDKAYVSIFPGDSSDADFVVAFEHGIEVMLCQSGIKQRYEGPENPSELKLAASLAKAEYWTDREAREVVRECELTKAAAILPDGASVELPDLAIRGRTRPSRGLADGERRAVESFFMACGASFARTALDALKDKVAVRGSSCEAEAQPPARGRKRKK